MIHSLYILNRAGGLIYQQDYTKHLNKLSSNDYLVFAGTIHGVHAIASKLTPENVKKPAAQSSATSLLMSPILSSDSANNSSANNSTIAGGADGSSGASGAGTSSGLAKMISNFTNTSNPAVNNTNLLSSSSISYNKLSSNFFYMNSNVTGLNCIETDMFNVYIYQTLTGVKFILIASPNIKNHDEKSSSAQTKSLNADYKIAEDLLRRVYVIYSDFVMKNPFYSLDMPIKADLFDEHVKKAVEAFN